MKTGVLKDTPLTRLSALGQSVWLDFIDRDLIRNGRLGRLAEEDDLRGVTSNPAIFEKAFNGTAYDRDIAAYVAKGVPAREMYECLTVSTVQEACDVLRPVYDEQDGRDGYVSIEVNPHLADDALGTIDEARRLWKAVDRPNVFVKIPATEAGLPAIRQCLIEGININVTLLFGLARYRQVAGMHFEAMEQRGQAGQSLDHVESVASFFLSRIDTMLDPLLEKIALGGAGSELASALRGQVAIGCAKLAYQVYKELYGSLRFAAMAEHGARTQRLLWASTSTKNPAYSDVKYIEPLIGRDTVNTIPIETLDAYRDHGSPALRLEEDVDRYTALLSRLTDVDIDLNEVAQRLEREGIEKFNKPYDASVEALRKKGAK
jgi:transaldolase